MTDWIRPIQDGWVVRDAVPGPDVDEFADPGQVIGALARPEAADGTLLAVQHPHRTPAALAAGLDVHTALPIAREVLNHIRANHYQRVRDVVAPYWCDGPDGSALGLLCLVDPAAVGADGLSLVRHTEDVYADVAADRAAVLAGLRCATSAAMLVPADDRQDLTDALLAAIDDLGAPVVSTVDSAGRRHRMWLLGGGRLQDEVLATARRHSLLVADGNHRVAAAALAGHDSLLALVTSGPQLRIGPIHRVLTGTGLGPADMARRWRATGLDVRPTTDRTPPAVPGTVVVLTGAVALHVTLPSADPAQPGPVIDHRVVEQVLVHRSLGIDPDGPALRPLLGGQPAGDADAVFLIAPVPFADVLAVHSAGHRMPRKATYFTPKPRSGLLLAEV